MATEKSKQPTPPQNKAGSPGLPPENPELGFEAEPGAEPESDQEPSSPITAAGRIADAKSKCRPGMVVVYKGDKIQTISAAMWKSRHKHFQKKGYELA